MAKYVIKKENIQNEAYIDTYRNQKDDLIGFDPELFLKDRIELKINLIYYDERLSFNDDSYDNFKKFKVNVVGGFYACDDKNTFQIFLDENKKLDKIPNFIIVSRPQYLEEISSISREYNMIKGIVLITKGEDRYGKEFMQSHRNVIHISSSYSDLIEYLKEIGKKTSNANIIFNYLKIFSSKRIFTSKEIQMDRQLSTCPIITAYEYDELYFVFHYAYAYFFTNNSSQNSPKFEEWPFFGEERYKKIKEFLKANDTMDNKELNELKNIFEFLSKSKNFTEDAIKKYCEEGKFRNKINQVLENFEKGLVQLAYFVGPFLFGLNKYALEHPDKSLSRDTTLYRRLILSPFEKYYTFVKKHIICFTSFTLAYTKDTKIKNKKEEDIEIEMVIKYIHQEGNISPAINIEEFSKIVGEMLIFPFTFFIVNNIEKKQNCQNCYIFNMEFINRKTFLEYKLREGKKYIIDYLEDELEGVRPLAIENILKDKTFNFNKKTENSCLII